MAYREGVDSALSYATIAQPELLVLFDTNPHVINYLHYRLEMTRYFQEPSDYLQSIFPGMLNFPSLLKAKSRIDISKLIDGEDLFGRSKRMKGGFEKIDAGVARIGDVSYLGTGVSIKKVIMESVINKHRWLETTSSPDRINPDGVLYSFYKIHY